MLQAGGVKLELFGWEPGRTAAAWSLVAALSSGNWEALQMH